MLRPKHSVSTAGQKVKENGLGYMRCYDEEDWVYADIVSSPLNLRGLCIQSHLKVLHET